MAVKNKNWSVTVNWDDVSDEAPPPPEKGIYKARCTSAEPEITKGEDMCLLTEWELLEPYGEHGGSLDGKSTSVRFQRLMVTGKGNFVLKQASKACEVTLPNQIDGKDLAESFVGAECYVRIKHRRSEENEAVYPEIGAYIPGDKIGEVTSGLGEATSAARPRKRKAR